MGPAYFGFDTRRLSVDVNALRNPRLGVGWGKHRFPAHALTRTYFLNLWVLSLWVRLELRGR